MSDSTNPDQRSMGPRGAWFSRRELPLQADITTLSALLVEVLQGQSGQALLDRIEALRLAAERHGRGDADGLVSLQKTLRALSPAEAQEVVRAFSLYFQLVNLAVTVDGLRRRREWCRPESRPEPGSFEAALETLRQHGWSRDRVRDALRSTMVSPVLTHHPTEAVRRTVLRKETRLADELVERLRVQAPTRREDARSLVRIRTEIEALWQTEEHRVEKPNVADEAEHVLFTLSDAVYPAIPRVSAAIEEAADRVFGKGKPVLEKPVVRFGSWVGGDMDGNPFVGAHTIRQTVHRQREIVLQAYRDDVKALFEHLSQSLPRVEVAKEISARITAYQEQVPNALRSIPTRYATMPYRRMAWLIWERLGGDPNIAADHHYGVPSELRADLSIMADSLRGHRAPASAALVERMIQRVDVFGFHLATLDIRQDADTHREALALLLDDAEFPSRTADARAEALAPVLRGDVSAADVPADSVAREMVDVMVAIAEGRQEHGSNAFGPYIVSMAQGPDDALGVMALARLSGFVEDGQVPLDVVPLFETVDDLENAGRTVRSLLADPRYREHLRARDDRQMIMLGYSDSSKDSGLAASRWALYRAQTDLVRAAREAGVQLELFHGRGGSISRGGSKPRDGILAAPPGAVAGTLRVTEQGEIIYGKYGLEPVAAWTLELMAAATLEASAEGVHDERPAGEHVRAMTELAAASRAAYRKLVYETPGFPEFFRKATPVDVIERMKMGSRPASRRKGGGIENLRAIPWVFSWTQSRLILPGWFGVGSGLEAAIASHGVAMMREMAAHWRFFDTLLADVEMVLAKVDAGIAQRYAALAGPEGVPLFETIREELERTRRAICRIRNQENLLDHDPPLQRALRLRDPHVAPMSFVQLDLLERWRASGRKDQALEAALVASVIGISRGMQNTG